MRKTLGVVAATLILTAVAGCGNDDGDPDGTASESPTATASPTEAESTPATGVTYFPSTVTPDSGVTAGAELTVEATGATPSTSYYCLLAVYTTEEEGVSAPLESSLQAVDSDEQGAISCTVTYEPFSAKDTRGAKRSCPTTAADRSDGFTCGVVLADAATVGAVSASAVPFTPKG